MLLHKNTCLKQIKVKENKIYSISSPENSSELNK